MRIALFPDLDWSKVALGDQVGWEVGEDERTFECLDCGVVILLHPNAAPPNFDLPTGIAQRLTIDLRDAVVVKWATKDLPSCLHLRAWNYKVDRDLRPLRWSPPLQSLYAPD